MSWFRDQWHDVLFSRLSCAVLAAVLCYPVWVWVYHVPPRESLVWLAWAVPLGYLWAFLNDRVFGSREKKSLTTDESRLLLLSERPGDEDWCQAVEYALAQRGLGKFGTSRPREVTARKAAGGGG